MHVFYQLFFFFFFNELFILFLFLFDHIYQLYMYTTNHCTSSKTVYTIMHALL